MMVVCGRTIELFCAITKHSIAVSFNWGVAVTDRFDVTVVDDTLGTSVSVSSVKLKVILLSVIGATMLCPAAEKDRIPLSGLPSTLVVMFHRIKFVFERPSALHVTVSRSPRQTGDTPEGDNDTTIMTWELTSYPCRIIIVSVPNVVS